MVIKIQVHFLETLVCKIIYTVIWPVVDTFILLTIPRADLIILKVLYKSTGSSALYGPSANNIGTIVNRNSLNVLTGTGAALLLNGLYVVDRIRVFKPLYLQIIRLGQLF